MDDELLLQISDQKLIKKIYEDERYLGVVYKKCQANCVNFLRIKNTILLSDAELEDIFSDAIIALLQKIRNNNFVLNASFQTYLNAVCEKMFLKKVRKKEFHVKIESIYKIENIDPEDDNHNSDNDSEKFGENLFYSFEKESEEKKDFFERYIIKMTRALELMSIKQGIRPRRGNCYQLITLFSYEDADIAYLTNRFGYANDAVTKTARYKCLRRLKLMIGQTN
jgi:DNA-directed RNA polymerase specialized sigma24 family protein